MKLSASRVSSFAECRLKYHYRYNLKLPSAPVTTRSVLGLAVHKALEIFYSEFRYQPLVLPTLEWLAEAYQRGWQQYCKSLSTAEYKKLREEGWQGIKAYYERHISTDGGHTGHFEAPFLVEQRFKARVLVANNWITLTGRFDRLDWIEYETSTLRLVEYKTSRRVPPDESDSRLKIQLGFYQWAIEQLYGYGLREVSYHYVLAGKEINYPCEPASRRAIEAIAEMVVETQDLEDSDESWPAQVGEHCRVCNFYRYCPSANPKAEIFSVKRSPKQLRLF